MGITKRTLKNGKTVWTVVEYTGFTLNGKRDRKTITCSTEKQAKIEQAKIVAMRDAMRNRSGRMNFAAYVEGWFWPSRQDLAPSTKDTYRRDINKRLMPAFGNLDIRDIDRAKIQRMVDGCSSENVARNAVGMLKTILNDAMRDGLILRNPACDRFSYPDLPVKRHNSLVITRFEHMRPLFDAVDAYGDPTIEKLCVLGLLMGLRPEERYGLDCQDISLSQRCVYVHQAYTAASLASGGTKVKPTKTEKSKRAIPIPATAMQRMTRLLKTGNIVQVGAFVRGQKGGRIYPSQANRQWNKFLSWCEKEGRDVPRVSLENMRHSFATSFLHAGGNVEDLSVILGHTDINTTFRRYVRPNADDLRSGMDAFIAV